MRNAVVALALTAAALPAQALQVSIRDAAGAPLPLAMVTLKAERPLRAARDDNGYSRERTEQRISPEITAFAGADGRVQVDYPEAVPLNLRVRVPGHSIMTTTFMKFFVLPAYLPQRKPASA